MVGRDRTSPRGYAEKRSSIAGPLAGLRNIILLCLQETKIFIYAIECI